LLGKVGKHTALDNAVAAVVDVVANRLLLLLMTVAVSPFCLRLSGDG